MKYERIVFLQGEEATAALDELEAHGEEEAIEYLSQWDMGDGGDIHDEPASGDSDNVYESDDGYRLSYNTRLGYIGLERLVEE